MTGIPVAYSWVHSPARLHAELALADPFDVWLAEVA